MRASVLSPASVDGVCGGTHERGNCMIVLRLHDAWLSKVRRRSRVTPRTRIESATGKSTSATDTDVKDDTALSCVAVLLLLLLNVVLLLNFRCCSISQRKRLQRQSKTSKQIKVLRVQQHIRYHVYMSRASK